METRQTCGCTTGHNTFEPYGHDPVKCLVRQLERAKREMAIYADARNALRDRLVAAALPALLEKHPTANNTLVAEAAYELADAVLAAREKKPIKAD